MKTLLVLDKKMSRKFNATCFIFYDTVRGVNL